MRGVVLVILVVICLTAVPWGTAASGIGGVADAITTTADTPDGTPTLGDTPTAPESSPTPPDDTPTPPESTPTPPESTPTPPDSTPTPPDSTPTPPDDTPTPPDSTPTPPDDTPTPPSTPTPPGGGQGSASVTNLRCVAACDGVDTSLIETRAQFLAMDGIRNVNVRLIAGLGLDLAAVGVTEETRFRADLKIEADAGFDPQTLVVIGSEPRLLSSTSGTTATATVEFGATSGAINPKVRVQDPDEWPERDVTATREVSAVAVVNVADVSDSSREDISEFDGVTIATNAQVFSPPKYEPGTTDTPPRIVIDVAAPHFLPDGTTQNTGEFTARLPDSLLDAWGVTDTAQLTANVSTGGGTLEIAETGDGIVVRLRNYHYSSGTVTVTKADSAESSSTATETATATASPTETATATPTATATAPATETPSATPTASPTTTVMPSPTTTVPPTSSPTASPTATTSATASLSPTASPTATSTVTQTTATDETTRTAGGADDGQLSEQTAASSPGFGAVAALVALLAGAVGLRRSR